MSFKALIYCKYMPKNLIKEDVNFGQMIFGWEINEYEEHERDKRWYIMMGVISVLLLLYAVLTANYLFALIIVLFAIILFLQDTRNPRRLPFIVAETGIILGNKFYSFSELKDFWIIYEPPMVKNLYFSTGSLVSHRLSIPLMDVDPRPIRKYLNEFLEENLDEEEEPLSDKISRTFRF